jgi:Uma2 family endonuclease
MAEQIVAESTEQAANPISFEEFLHQYDGKHAEWIDGEVILMTPPSIDHQKLLGFLYMLLATFLGQRPLGIVVFAPVAMKIEVGEKEHAREPDLVFVSTEHSDRLKANYIDGPADLVVEVVSPESNARDRGPKFTEYEAAGIGEFWLIDPIRSEAAFYHLDDDNHYHRIEPQPGGTLHSLVLPGFRLHPQVLWSDPLPTVPEIVTLVNQMVEGDLV